MRAGGGGGGMPPPPPDVIGLNGYNLAKIVKSRGHRLLPISTPSPDHGSYGSLNTWKREKYYS